jgi:hypothetical protein
MNNKLIIGIIGICFFWGGCRQSSRLEHALTLAGANRVELEKVLNHYRDEPLKYRAAVFLIENMPPYYGYDGARVDTIRKALTVVHDLNGFIYDKDLIRAASDFPYSELNKVYDIQVITAEYLCETIDMAFEQWEKRPWNRTLSFEDFCEYLLPYRVRTEMLEPWRKAYYDKYAKALDSLYTGNDPIEAADVLNRYVRETERVAFNYDEVFRNVSPGSLYFLQYKSGSCIDMKDASLYMLRACGIPAVCHYYPYSPNLSGRHTWAAIRDTTGRDIPFSAPGMAVGRNIDIGFMKGKIYRQSYGASLQQSPVPIHVEDVLPEFRNPYVSDASVHYTGENAIRAHVTKKGNRYMYLSVQTGQRTTPIAVSKAQGDTVVFPWVEEGLIYQLFHSENGRLVPAGYPILFHDNHTHAFIPDTSHREKLTLYRKYGLNDSIYRYMNFIVGGVLEGSQDAGFTRPVFHYTVTDSLRGIIRQTVYPSTNEPIRYIRFTTAKENRIDIAEIEIFTEMDTINALSGVKVTVPKQISMGIFAESLTDGNLLTYYMSIDLGATFTLDIGHPLPLHRIELTPRTDDNFVRPGDVYELHYHAGIDGWISMGKQKAEQLYLKYEDVPADALLWLQNHTRGQEEQVFYMKDGRQVFAGKNE